MFLNHVITLPVIFHSFTFKLLYSKESILSIISLQVLPISFLAGFISRVVGWLKMFVFWSFNVMKQLPVPLCLIILPLMHIKYRGYGHYLVRSQYILYSYYQAEEYLITWKLSFISLSCIMWLLYCLLMVLSTSLMKNFIVLQNISVTGRKIVGTPEWNLKYQSTK